MRWIEDENRRKVVGFIFAGICTVVGALWTLFIFFFDPADPKIKPHLKVYSQKYVDQKLIAIKNIGFGPAIITQSEFCRELHCTNNLVELFNIDVTWDTYKNLTKGVSIPSGEILTLLKLGINETQGKTIEILEEWQMQKKGIKVKISYEDMEGNMYGPLITTLN